ncbi:MAG: MFS transporter, partial [Micromonosporaceae bacterium]
MSADTVPPKAGPTLRGRLGRLLPSEQLGRRLAVQSALYAVGSGVFVTGNAVFFTVVVGLSASQVGLGFSVAGMVSFALAVPLGRLADRIGGRRTWVLAASAEALIYVAYPWIRGFAAFLAIVILLAAMESLGSFGRGAYTLSALPRGERVSTLAYVRSALNVGFTVGALLGGLALAANDRTITMLLPLLTAAVLLVNAVLVYRLPQPRHEPGAVEPSGSSPPRRPGPIQASRAALRNLGFVALSGLNGLLGLNSVLLNVVIPLWVVQRTDAPHALLAWLFGTNTVMVVLLQVRAARGSESVRGAVRAYYLAAICFVSSCVLVMTSGWTYSWATIGLLWLGYIAVTGSELFHSAAVWGVLAELSDPTRRAEYQSVFRLGAQLQRIIGPAAFTWLALGWRPEGWLVIAAFPIVGAMFLPYAARAAARFAADFDLRT